MGKRHEAIGIKQAIRLEWMQKVVDLLHSGLEAKTIRRELHEFLAGRMGSGAEGDRGAVSRNQVVNMLMNIWVSPDPVLIAYRNDALAYLQENPKAGLAVHWGMLSAAYPFWFNVARQTGRLLALQDQVTQAQVTQRLKEQYGDRQTVSRYARYVIRSFIAWGTLKDSETKGCYEKARAFVVTDQHLAVLLLEAQLHMAAEGKAPLTILVSNPGLFPFQLPVITGDAMSRENDRIHVVRYGLDDELLKLKFMGAA